MAQLDNLCVNTIRFLSVDAFQLQHLAKPFAHNRMVDLMLRGATDVHDGEKALLRGAAFCVFGQKAKQSQPERQNPAERFRAASATGRS
jgi:hypothetical protein